MMHGNVPRSLKEYAIHTTETISMCIVPIRLYHKDKSIEILTYALLDENCQGTFVLESIINDFSIDYRKTSITTETINGAVTESSLAVDGLIVKPLPRFEEEYGSSEIVLPTAYSR